MVFDWPKAIGKNRDDLIEIVTRLFVLAGIRTGRSVVFLPRALRLRILAVLRPAEYAARRLIAMAACALAVPVARPAGKRASRPPANAAPGGHLPAFALFDPLKPFAHPWLEEEDRREGEPGRTGPFADPGEPVDGRAVCRRICALEAALQDIEGQAKRLARWRARRGHETCRPQRWRPMRPGLPPGWRKRPRTPVEEVLKECHSLALYAWDTS